MKISCEVNTTKQLFTVLLRRANCEQLRSGESANITTPALLPMPTTVL